MERTITVRGVALHQGKLLCVRLNKYQEGIQQAEDYWCLPGGKLETGESITAGIAREMIEETGIKPDIGNLLYVQQFAMKGREFLEFFFHITNGEDYLQVDLSKTTHGEEEIAEIAYVDASQTHILPAFLSTEDVSARAASAEPTRIMNRFDER